MPYIKSIGTVSEVCLPTCRILFIRFGSNPISRDDVLRAVEDALDASGRVRRKGDIYGILGVLISQRELQWVDPEKTTAVLTEGIRGLLERSGGYRDWLTL